MKRALFVLALLILAFVAYYLPWYTHKTAGFTMNAFDLAEWSSLHPAVRAESPELLTTLLLRLPHLLITTALALSANGLRDPRLRWLVRALALALTLRTIPPTDFFRSASDDPNYRQMAWLTVAGILLALAALPISRLKARWQMGLIALLLVIASWAGWAGLSRTSELMNNFEIDVHTGPGIVILTLMAALLVLTAVLGDRRFIPERK